MRSHRLRAQKLSCGVALCAMAVNAIAAVAAASAQSGSNDDNTKTPIKHVIVIIGENRSFDHLFATYQPVNQLETVLNLLSEGVVNADGTPGPKYSTAAQSQAQNTTIYQISPSGKSPYTTLPAPLAGGGYFHKGLPPFSNVEDASTYENGLPLGDYKYLTTGKVPTAILGEPDIRILYDGKDVSHLPPGPYQLTPGIAYDDYAEDPVHRFYQM